MEDFIPICALACLKGAVSVGGLDSGGGGAMLALAPVWGGLQMIWRLCFGGVTHGSGVHPEDKGLGGDGWPWSGSASDVDDGWLSTDAGRVALTEVLACVRFAGVCCVGFHFF